MADTPPSSPFHYLGVFALLPLELRDAIYCFYFHDATSTATFDNPAFSNDWQQHIQIDRHDTNLLLASKTIYLECSPYHKPTYILHCLNLTCTGYGLRQIADLSCLFAFRPSIWILNIYDWGRYAQGLCLDKLARGAFPRLQRLELRVSFSAEEIAIWCRRKRFSKLFASGLSAGRYDDDFLRCLKGILRQSGSVVNDVGRCKVHGLHKETKIDVRLDVEAWRAKRLERCLEPSVFKALHFVMNLKTWDVEHRYVVRRSLGERDGISGGERQMLDVG